MEVTGCGPTCLSMVLVHLLQDATFTPRYVADFAEDNDYYAKGSGSKWALISEGGETLGLDVTELPLDENRMKKNLELGNPVICIMGPGDFTTAGHFIVLTGVKENKFVVNDPNSKENSERLWSYEEISGQIKNLWACKLPE
jgi:ABC-type bacteriocin/lantibiotic exporter with double-glycine peptidase domain